MNKLFILCLIILTVSAAHAHSGGTNSQGCHTNSKTGDYHCH
ncbi:YHYH domain-containing protein [Acinetobacter sp. Marseille-Q1618]|nr:YHYH domain-containing protein [Acinetobacter sp. Marseille-Q1618]